MKYMATASVDISNNVIVEVNNKLKNVDRVQIKIIDPSTPANNLTSGALASVEGKGTSIGTTWCLDGYSPDFVLDDTIFTVETSYYQGATSPELPLGTLIEAKSDNIVLQRGYGAGKVDPAQVWIEGLSAKPITTHLVIQTKIGEDETIRAFELTPTLDISDPLDHPAIEGEIIDGSDDDLILDDSVLFFEMQPQGDDLKVKVANMPLVIKYFAMKTLKDEPEGTLPTDPNLIGGDSIVFDDFGTQSGSAINDQVLNVIGTKLSVAYKKVGDDKRFTLANTSLSADAPSNLSAIKIEIDAVGDFGGAIFSIVLDGLGEVLTVGFSGMPSYITDVEFASNDPVGNKVVIPLVNDAIAKAFEEE